MTDTPEEMPTVEVVYMGRRTLKGGKPGDLFITLAQLDTLTEGRAGNDTVEYAASIFDPGRSRHATVIGGVYTVEANVEDGKIRTIRFGTMKFARRAGHDFEGTWAAEDKALSLKKRAEAELAKASKDDALSRDIDRLIYHYRRVSPASRQAFKLMVLDALDKGRVK